MGIIPEFKFHNIVYSLLRVATPIEYMKSREDFLIMHLLGKISHVEHHDLGLTVRASVMAHGPAQIPGPNRHHCIHNVAALASRVRLGG